ncbi:hypothetical protein BKA64DRAFT_765783 [Cadophora sp. MPI-SDFR-AT-0126]|nr:hypothetical protein BKA64DRAFT_765783 [Leotiomycetes sp. MPI-SDFR-AT-0126]
MVWVAVAGRSGKLGRTIVEAILKQGEHKVVVLARSGNESKAKELGVPVLAIDYSDVEATKEVLQSNNITTVVSTLDTAKAGPDSEIALIKAADASTTTERYIPSFWGIRYTPEVAKTFPIAEGKIAILAALEASTLEYTNVINGLFADYFVGPKVPSYMGPFTMNLDMDNHAAAIPGSGNVPVSFTHTTDVARFAAGILSLSTWQPESVIVGQKLTWNEVVALAERAKGVKFDVTHDAVERLQRHEVTELPGHKIMYSYLPKPMFQGLAASFGLLFDGGFFDIDVDTNPVDIKVRSVEELMKESWKTS